MNKKNYLLIGGTILIFIVIIAIILFTKKKDTNWTSEVLNSNNYQISMIDCNGREKEFKKNIINELEKKWSDLSNNGPWTGNNNICYSKLTISYESNGIINKKEILIIDESSIAIIENTNTVYYTNAADIINYINSIFIVD